MKKVFRFPPSPCEYLPDQQSQLYYELSPQLQPIDFMKLLREGWRRFGPVVFRPECPSCRRCLSLRVLVAEFRPSESQRRARRRNDGEIELRVAAPSIDPARLELFINFHEHGHQTKGWPSPAEEPESELQFHLFNPFPTEEWSYWINDRLVGVGYVDTLPEGLSAIYFFHEPDQHQRSLGTFHILKMIERAKDRQLPHLYLGYYVEACRSLEYKKSFRPNEILHGDAWEAFIR